MAQHQFNWSLLDRSSLIHLIHELAPYIVNQPVPIDQFHKTISKQIRTHLPVRITRFYDRKVDSNHVYMGGTYYSDRDKNRTKCIEIVFIYNPNDDKIVCTPHRFKRFSTLFADTLLHELIHMRQYRRRKFKVLPEYDSNAEKTEKRQEQGYLGSSDEIDAYGFNIACELMEKFKNNQRLVIKHLNEDQQGRRRRMDCWRMYLAAFDHNHDHKIIKRVKTKVIRYLPYAEIGKPYRNKDWIDR